MKSVTSNAVAENINNQNVLSDVKDITLSTSRNNPTIMQYDGVLTIGVSGGPRTIYLNDRGFVTAGDIINGNNILTASTINFRKGDSMYTNTSGTIDVCKARYYKLRDYSLRT